MKLFGIEVNRRYGIWLAIQLITIIDIVLISIDLLFTMPPEVSSFIRSFDFIVCAILLLQWFYVFYISKPKSIFVKQTSNWIDLIASIPFDTLLPVLLPHTAILRYLKLLRFLRVFVLFKRFSNGLRRFFEKTYLDKIIALIILLIAVFTILLNLYGSTYGPFEDFYFVIVTLTTVGYGDVVPQTFAEKIIAIVLLFVGVFVFSTITAAISSFLTDRLMNKDAYIKNEIESLHRENDELKEEIQELKELIKKIER